LTANNILHYVFGTLPCPLATIGTSDASVENPTFLALFGTGGPEAQIMMSSATSFVDAMSRLTKFYANWSRTRIMSLKEGLSSITKGDSNVCDYLRSIRSVADELALIDHYVDDFDFAIMATKCLSVLQFQTEKLYTSRYVHFVENVFPYSSALITTSFPSPTFILTCIQPSSSTPLNHIQIIPKSISQNSNSISIASFLPTTSQNLSFAISMPTSPYTSSPPHVLPNSSESSPPSNHDDHARRSSSCSPGPK